jgi:hypothetical protein
VAINGYIGNPKQLSGVRRVTMDDGRAKGCSIIEAYTAGGLFADILPDMVLDIGMARYKGVNVSFLSKNGYDSPATFIPYENEFINTFPGGLVYTCGLRSVGPANRDGGEYHPLHGRFHGLQAEEVCAETIDSNISIRGVLRETALFGHVLEARRVITMPADGASIRVTDSVTNLEPRPDAFMLLYHINLGYPLLNENAKLILPSGRDTTPRTAFAESGLGRECEFDKPIDGEDERVFFHTELSEYRAALENRSIGIAAELTWSGDILPILAEWRSMASGDYVLGLEPSNSYVMGRGAERENGSLRVIQPFETVKTFINIKFKEMEK